MVSASNPTIDFSKLVEDKKFSFRTNVQLYKSIEQAFNRGLGSGVSSDAELQFIRQHAYLLLFGISKEQMRREKIDDYNALIEKSINR